MRSWVTEIQAIDPYDGELKKWAGPYVPGITRRDAQIFCQLNGLGYCHVTGILVAEIKADEENWEVDFSQRNDFDQIENN